MLQFEAGPREPYSFPQKLKEEEAMNAYVSDYGEKK